MTAAAASKQRVCGYVMASYSRGDSVACGNDCSSFACGVDSSFCEVRAAELGRQLWLIHVDTPNRGKIHACSANQSTRNPMINRISIVEDPS
jgi:hypothetical protein